MAGQEGLEPPTGGFGDRCSTNWSYWPVPMVGHEGLEPSTLRLKGGCSNQLS